MGKKTWMFSVVALTVFVLSAREYFIHEEISAIQSQLRGQLKEQFDLAQDMERLQSLSVAPVVYDRYLEPVFVSAHKLLWPLSRESEMTTWRREVHRLIDDSVYQKTLKIKADVDAEVSRIQSNEEPSIQRLLNVLDARARMIADTSIRQSIHAEVQHISQSAREQDMATLKEIRGQGVDIVKSFRDRVKKMDARGLAQFVSTGSYHREVQQPVLNLIFKLRQEEARRRTWAEFQKTILDILESKSFRLAKAKHPESTKKFQALFDSVADAIRKEESLTSAERLKVLPQETPPPAADPNNPAGLDYNN